jgi:hypothetical protein
MNSDPFESELRFWDRQLLLQNGKFLPFVDSRSAYPVFEDLQNIKLAFLLANITYVLTTHGLRSFYYYYYHYYLFIYLFI